MFQLLENVKSYSLWWLQAKKAHFVFGTHMWWLSPLVCLDIGYSGANFINFSWSL